MNKSFLSEIAVSYGFEVCGDFFSPYPVNDDAALYPLSFLENYLK